MPDNSGTPSSLVNCGSGLLAFQTSDGKIFIINTATLPNQFLANLSLAESASPNPATPGAAVTFTTTVTNRGPARATGVVLTNGLPAGTSLISLGSSQGVCTNNGGTLVCTLGNLDAGASATMTFVVLPAAGGTVRAVSGVKFNEQDPDPSDNIATGVTYMQESRSDGIQTFQLATSDLVYDPFGKRLYLSVPAGTVGEGNSIMTLDPVTGMIGSPLPVGNGPDKLALSGDGRYLYVGLDLDSAVRRVRLDTQTPDLQFSVGNGLLVADMEVVPQNPAVVAVSRRHVAGGSPQHAGVAVYDGGTQRSQTTSVSVYANVIAYSDSPSTLYAFGNESSDFLFHTLQVNGSGVSVQSSTAGLISGFGVDMKYAAGRVYATSGAVVDPAALSVVGTFTGAGLGTFNGSGYGPLVQPDTDLVETSASMRS